MAAATFGAGLGGAILVPLNAFVIEQWGVLATGVVLAVVTLGIIGPIALWVIKDGPEVLGQNPDGRTTVEPDEAHAREIEHDSRLWTVKEAFRTVAFWGLSSCFAVGMLAQGSYLVHQMIFLQSTFGMIGSAWIVTVTTLMGLVGRVGFMLIGKRFTPRVWVALMFAIQAASFLLLATGTSELCLTVGSALFGLTMGVIVVLQPLATAAVFGQPSFGRIYGPIYMSIRIGSALGPMLAGILVVSTGNYQSVWMLLGCGLLVGSVGIFWAMSARHDTRWFLPCFRVAATIRINNAPPCAPTFFGVVSMAERGRDGFDFVRCVEISIGGQRAVDGARHTVKRKDMIVNAGEADEWSGRDQSENVIAFEILKKSRDQ